MKLVDEIKQEDPSVRIAISSLTRRAKNPSFYVSKAVNSSLKSCCEGRNWDFISHYNIDDSCLNKEGLHLNLASNFRNYINYDY